MDTLRTARRRLSLLAGSFAVASLAQVLSAQSKPLPYFDQIGPMFVDVDGAPNAYGPPGKPTLDFEKNAHHGGKLSGRIVGYLTESDHRTPVIQGPNDPRPATMSPPLTSATRPSAPRGRR